MRKLFLFFVLLVHSLNPLLSQETSKLPQLDILTGTWDVTLETRLSATGPWETNTGISVIRKSTGSSLIEEDYAGKLQGKSFSTKAIIAFNHFNQKFQRIFVDSEHGVLIDYDGEKNSDSINFDKTWTYANSSTVQLRVTYKIISRDEFTVVNMRMPRNTSTWDVTGRARYVRKKSAE